MSQDTAKFLVVVTIVISVVLSLPMLPSTLVHTWNLENNGPLRAIFGGAVIFFFFVVVPIACYNEKRAENGE